MNGLLCRLDKLEEVTHGRFVGEDVTQIINECNILLALVYGDGEPVMPVIRPVTRCEWEEHIRQLIDKVYSGESKLETKINPDLGLSGSIF